MPINLEIPVEKELALKFCQSIEKKFFEGLDNEFTLKYEYFFSSIPKGSVADKSHFLDNFFYEVHSNCDYEVSESNKNEFKKYLEKFFAKSN